MPLGLESLRIWLHFEFVHSLLSAQGLRCEHSSAAPSAMSDTYWHVVAIIMDPDPPAS